MTPLNQRSVQRDQKTLNTLKVNRISELETWNPPGKSVNSPFKLAFLNANLSISIEYLTFCTYVNGQTDFIERERRGARSIIVALSNGFSSYDAHVSTQP